MPHRSMAFSLAQGSTWCPRPQDRWPTRRVRSECQRVGPRSLAVFIRITREWPGSPARWRWRAAPSPPLAGRVITARLASDDLEAVVGVDEGEEGDEAHLGSPLIPMGFSQVSLGDVIAAKEQRRSRFDRVVRCDVSYVVGRQRSCATGCATSVAARSTRWQRRPSRRGAGPIRS